MKYSHAKTALTMLIVSFFVTIAGAFIGSFISGNVGTIISALITIGCGVLELVAFGIGGKDSKGFKTAFKIEIISLILSIVAAIISVVGSGAAWAAITSTILSAAVSVIGVLTFYFIWQACGEVTESEKIQHFAKTTYIWYTVGIVLYAAMSIINTLVTNNAGTATAGVLAILAVIALFVAEILQIILIFRAHKHCK